jgi:adenosylhomocysteine nucleosidase
MNQTPAIIAALPRELKLIVRGWQQHKRPGNILVYTNDRAVAVCAGMGPQRATLAVEAALSARPVTALISIGLAGGCDPTLHSGDIMQASLVIDAQTGERFGDLHSKQVLVSTTGIASVKEKQRLRDSYAASAVDMEAAAVARLAEAHSLTFRAIKAISDDASFELRELARFSTQDGQFREAAFTAYAAMHPRLWPKLIDLARNSNRALQALSNELETQLDLIQQGA